MTSPWRKGVHSMKKRMEVALNNNISDIPHDVIFIVGKEKTKISCHKLMLTIASPVFQRMFSNQQCKSEDSKKSVFSAEDSKKSVFSADDSDDSFFSAKDSGDSFISANDSGNSSISANDSGNSSISANDSDDVKYNIDERCYKRRKIVDTLEISLPEVYPTGLKNLINYAYIGNLDIRVEEAFDTMHCAVLYDIPELIEYCLDVLSSRDLTITNAIEIYQAAEYCNYIQIRENAWQFIETNPAAFLDVEQFLTFSEKNLCNFLLLDCMPDLNSEIQIFNAVSNWGRHKCERKGLERTTYNIKKILENVIPLVRFPVMHTDEFNEVVVPSGILSAKECLPLYKYFTSSGKKRLMAANELKYSCSNRTPLRTFPICNTAATNTLKTVNGGVYDTFYLNEGSGNVILTGFGVVLPENFKLTEGIRFSVWDETHKSWLTYSTQTLTKRLEVCYLKFHHGVTIRSGVKYCLCVNFNNKGYETVVSNPVSVVRFSSNLLDTLTFNWTNAVDEKFEFTFTPHHCIAWGLQFEH